MKKLFACLLVITLLCTTACSSGDKGASGTYSATEKGYGGDITVTLEVKDGKIADVKIVGDKETADIGSKAVEEMPALIVAANSYDVDVISGATITSTSIKKATKAAMTEAGLIASDPSVCDGNGEVTLESINEFLNSTVDIGEGTISNVVAVIPVSHINGPREEFNFYAFVNFKYVARNYVKYQITYLSCTCRSAAVNYWSTMYVEMTLPDSKDINDAEIKYMSFDYDSEGAYLAGFWGDSNPTPAGHTYEDIKEEYISYFFGKNYAYTKTLSVVEDIDPADYQANGRDGLTLDSFVGSSVSTNNIIRTLNALFEYHGTDSHFNN